MKKHEETRRCPNGGIPVSGWLAAKYEVAGCTSPKVGQTIAFVARVTTFVPIPDYVQQIDLGNTFRPNAG